MAGGRPGSVGSCANPCMRPLKLGYSAPSAGHQRSHGARWCGGWWRWRTIGSARRAAGWSGCRRCGPLAWRAAQRSVGLRIRTELHYWQPGQPLLTIPSTLPCLPAGQLLGGGGQWAPGGGWRLARVLGARAPGAGGGQVGGAGPESLCLCWNTAAGIRSQLFRLRMGQPCHGRLAGTPLTSPPLLCLFASCLQGEPRAVAARRLGPSAATGPAPLRNPAGGTGRQGGIPRAPERRQRRHVELTGAGTCGRQQRSLLPAAEPGIQHEVQCCIFSQQYDNNTASVEWQDNSERCCGA